MRHRLLVAAAIALLPAPFLAAADVAIPDIPFQKYVLKNGLTLVVHEDHKAPIAAVNVWYHVGSKNEKAGKTGFAHLFEHLMFNGSENFNDDYFKVLEKVGATDLNGTTNEDRTNYFQNVPVSALDTVLWMESDRMGHLLGAIDQAKLDEQRGVVQNEKRQGENEPYGRVEELIQTAVYPKGHPYSWTVIGSMEDLERRLARRREGVVQDLLRPVERGARGGRRREGRGRPGAGREVLRRHPARAADREARGVDREADGRAAPEARGPGAAGAHLQGLEHAAVGHAGRRRALAPRLGPRLGQELAPVQAARLRRPDRNGRVGVPRTPRRSAASSSSRRRRGRAATSRRSRAPSTRRWPAC